jgi:serine/threonine-protein kinase
MPSTDRNLLFGILALQMDFVSREALIAAMNAWVLDKAKPLGQILREQGQLSAQRQHLLDALVEEHLQAHQCDPQQSLAALGAVAAELTRIPDDDVQASLQALCTASDRGEANSAGFSPSRYRTLHEHARGGLGLVFVAEDLELQRAVALKEIRPDHAHDPNSRRRFLLEARVNGRLEHPGIVPVYGLGTYPDGRPYYAMRFIKGQTLKEAIQHFHEADKPSHDPGERRLALRQLLSQFVAICNAVAYAHSRGVIHRDLKPGNAMLGKFGETLLVDWGLAKVVGRPQQEETYAEAAVRPEGSHSSATQLGQAMGTPGYMSPEQARGNWDMVGPATDVYGLGATLYTLLTGKAPVEGKVPHEVIKKVIQGEWLPPRQVKRDTPRALDAICCKAMALRPEDRYASALDLAADVEHWLADEPVSAWREPWRVRAGRWARRHQTLVAAVAAGMLVTVLAGGAGLWWLDRQSTERRQGVEAALAEVRRLQGEARWAEARAVLEQATNRLGDGGPHDLKARLDRARADLDLVAQLDAIRLKRTTVVEGRFDFAGADRGYEEAFREGGMPEVRSEAAEAAAWVRGSGVREALVAALDDWASCAEDRERRNWVLEVVRLADPDPWRDRVRDPAVWENGATLARLTAEKQVAEQSPQLLAGLGVRLMELGADAEGFLRAAQQRHPGDFWVNFDLGNALADGKKHGEAVSYYRAALAVRPRTPAAHYNLGNALYDKGQWEEAVAEYRLAIKLDPKLGLAHDGLGSALYAKGQWEEAVTEYRTAIKLDPKDAKAHNGLGSALYAKSQWEAAVTEYRMAIKLDPKYAQAHNNLGLALYAKGQWEEAVTEYRTAIKLDPKHAKAHNGLGSALYAKGQWEAAVAEFRLAIKLDPKDALAHYNLGLALYDRGLWGEAVAEYRLAIKLDPKYAQAHNNLGNALYAQGQWEEAVAEFRLAIELDPKLAQAHGALGQALLQQGQFTQAQESTRRCLQLLPAQTPLRHLVEEQLRQCDRMLALDKKLVAVLKGEAQPTDITERLSFAELSGLKKRHADAVQFYADAFAAEPKLADNLQAQNRYKAACSAALAAAGQGQDPMKSTQLRKQALDWLRADLALSAKRLESGKPNDRAEVQNSLQHWQQAPDLTGIRDGAALAKLPQAEREACQKLWADVAALLKKAGKPAASQ